MDRSGRSIVQVGGMGWSGSGAVIDAMLDTGGIVSLKGKTISVGETCLFVKGPAPLRFLGAVPEAVGDGPTLAALWTAGRIGLSDSPFSSRLEAFIAAEHPLSASNRKTFLTLDDDQVRTLADAAAAAMAAASDPDERARRYVHWTRRGLAAVAAHHGLTVVLNNDPGIATVRDEHLVDPDTLMIGVVREPGDLFQDRRNGVNKEESAVRNLARALASALRRRREYRRIIDLARRDPTRVWLVTFERFVRDADHRAELLAAAGLPSDGFAPERFIATRSSRNIGLASRGLDRIARRVFTTICGRTYRAACELAVPERWRHPSPALASKDRQEHPR